jgi:thymidine phosphorylase
VTTPVAPDHTAGASTLRARRLGLHTHDQPVVVMRSDCHICRSEGLSSRSHVLLDAGDRQVHAALHQVDGDWLAVGDAGLSEAAWTHLGVVDGAEIRVRHATALDSLASVRHRIYGNRLDAVAISSIIGDIAAGHYSDVQLAAFLTAGSAFPFDAQETVDLTSAMVKAGERLLWDAPVVVDKHCVGGLPGNRTTPIVVAIVAANGLLMPKTSSRAITSPAGTADTMETLAPVDLTLNALRRVVGAEGGCIAWGGAVQLSPADDMLVRIERELDIDAEGQLIASVLSKKIAAGASHVVIDIPVGPTAKVRTEEVARSLGDRLAAVAARFGLHTTCLRTDGLQPVGRGIGPALEAHDILAVLQNMPTGPSDLRERAATLAGAALEIGGAAIPGAGRALALATLESGSAWRKFQRICEAQGGMRVPPRAELIVPITSARAGRVVGINNRKLARLAKFAGAPRAQIAGVHLEVRVGDAVDLGQPLLHLHSATSGELAYALEYAAQCGEIFALDGERSPRAR